MEPENPMDSRLKHRNAVASPFYRAGPGLGHETGDVRREEDEEYQLHSKEAWEQTLAVRALWHTVDEDAGLRQFLISAERERH